MAENESTETPAPDGTFRTRAQRAEESYADTNGSVSVRTDDRFGQPRKNESIHGWQAREKAWKGKASPESQKAGDDATFKANMDRHAEGVARVKAAEQAKATAARQTLLSEARVARAKIDAAAEEEKLLAWHKEFKRQSSTPGRV